MSTSAAVQQTNTMHYDLRSRSAGQVIKEEKSSAKAEKIRSQSAGQVIKEEKSSAKAEKIRIQTAGQVIKEEKSSAKAEKIGDFSSKTHVEGTRDSPIMVAPFRNGGQGSKIKPICLEDDVEVVGDRDHPISLDDQFSDEVEELFIQSAIKDSLMDLEPVECFEVDPDDPKGKKPKRESRLKRLTLIQEVGESSNPPPPKPDAYCGICMEPKFNYECFSLKNCSHVYCSSCVSQYVEAKVEENVTSILCPDPSCKNGYLEPEMCQSIVKHEVFNRWSTALCEAMIGSMKFYCPFKDCSALLIDEGVGSGGDVIRQSECPHCFRLFCAQCKVPWHSGVDCKEFSKLGSDEREKEDIMLRKLANDCKWQRCPSCKFYVEKIDGCMFIACRCGYRFCYGCATQMTVDHYCKKCKR